MFLVPPVWCSPDILPEDFLYYPAAWVCATAKLYLYKGRKGC